VLEGHGEGVVPPEQKLPGGQATQLPLLYIPGEQELTPEMAILIHPVQLLFSPVPSFTSPVASFWFCLSVQNFTDPGAVNA
jgi:hypothetical protein